MLLSGPLLLLLLAIPAVAGPPERLPCAWASRVEEFVLHSDVSVIFFCGPEFGREWSDGELDKIAHAVTK